MASPLSYILDLLGVKKLYVSGSAQTYRNGLDLVAGSGVTLTPADDASADTLRVTVGLGTSSASLRLGQPGEYSTADVIGAGTTNVRQRAVSLAAPRNSAASFRYVRLFMTDSPSANENFVVHIYTRTGGTLYTSGSPNFTQAAVSGTHTLGAAAATGIVEFDMGSTVSIAAGTMFWVGISAVSASGSITPAKFAVRAPTSPTANYIGSGWTYAPGSAVDYSGGALTASAPSWNIWMELA